MKQRNQLLTTKEAAEYLRVSVSLLKKWRSEPVHPLKFYKLGRKVMYSRHMCDKFLETRCSSKIL